MGKDCRAVSDHPMSAVSCSLIYFASGVDDLHAHTRTAARLGRHITRMDEADQWTTNSTKS